IRWHRTVVHSPIFVVRHKTTILPHVISVGEIDQLQRIQHVHVPARLLREEIQSLRGLLVSEWETELIHGWIVDHFPCPISQTYLGRSSWEFWRQRLNLKSSIYEPDSQMRFQPCDQLTKTW